MENRMIDTIRFQIIRQIEHWLVAAERLGCLNNFASEAAWSGLETYLGVLVRERMLNSVSRMVYDIKMLRSQLIGVQTIHDINTIQKELLRIRTRYQETEMTIEYFCDAINTRTSPEISAILRAYDIISVKSMEALLEPLGHKTPPVLTYIDKGIGASILKAGLRLWDRNTINPVAMIKIVWHNMFRPTSLIHEAGHQVAHVVGWNEELAMLLMNMLSPYSGDIARIWSGWASEIAADAFAFVHTGFSAVAALHDVIAGDSDMVFRFNLFDPHPICYLRVLLAVEMCRYYYGSGPWDSLADAWMELYRTEYIDEGLKRIIQNSIKILPHVVEAAVGTRMKCFGSQSLASVIDPQRVCPKELAALECTAGYSLYQSPYYLSKECIRIMAVTGLQAAMVPNNTNEFITKQKEWMMKLGCMYK